MRVGERTYRTIWLAPDGEAVEIIDQTVLPHRFSTVRLGGADDAARAIKTMQVRGAPLIGAAAAHGLALAMRSDPSNENLTAAHAQLLATRPTAVNLRWALDDVRARLVDLPPAERFAAARARAVEICDQDVAMCEAMGRHGAHVLARLHSKLARPINVLTHCNAGWLAAVDWGTALAPIYRAHNDGIPVHVWVDETRPRNQGASLTAWELSHHGVPHTVITDNAGGHLMQHGRVDVCITGTDRTTARGDVCNKIGTYLKALAARANDLPFYVAAPSPSIDWTLWDGRREIPIEERDAREVSHIRGRGPDGDIIEVALLPEGSAVVNHGFDVTPAELVTGLITERGICPATPEGLRGLFPEHAATATTGPTR